jgi:hypothetical protein
MENKQMATQTQTSSNDRSTNGHPAPNMREQGENRDAFREGPVAYGIEKQTAKLPSDLFLWAALGSIGLSLTLQLMGKRERSNFVGHWAPTFLALGLYNKIVKVAGHDRARS